MVALLLGLAISIPVTGRVVLPAGVVEVAEELQIPAGAHELTISGHPNGTTLRFTPSFHGRGAVVCERGVHITITGLAVDGARANFSTPVGLPPSDVRFADFYKRSGIWADRVQGLTISQVSFVNMPAFSVLVSRSQQVRIGNVLVKDSGGRDGRSRNNTSGGVLLEEGTSDFEVSDSVFEDVLGNGVWTHSNYGSPRNARGLIAGNRFHRIARDAIQVGHATSVRVSGNSGDRIGYPFDAVDVERSGIPVAIDTSGNVDRSIYTQNRFTEVNGKCIDLDGFHDGAVTFNTCVNKGVAADYPHGQAGIVVNNANPGMRSERITIADNTIDGVKFTGLFLIGSHHTVARNKLLNLNLAHCNENAAQYYGCIAIPGEPKLLESGIYIGAKGERDAPSTGNVIRGNIITGWKMEQRCIAVGAHVDMHANILEGNVCRNQ